MWSNKKKSLLVGEISLEQSVALIRDGVQWPGECSTLGKSPEIFRRDFFQVMHDWNFVTCIKSDKMKLGTVILHKTQWKNHTLTRNGLQIWHPTLDSAISLFLSHPLCSGCLMLWYELRIIQSH